MATAVITSFIPILDANGVPYGASQSARVFVLDVGATTLKSVYSNEALSVAASNPISLADGRHAIRYIAPGTYKIVTEINGTTTLGSGTTLANYSWDNIDPGVAIGSGALPVGNGGTAATTAAAARTNLGAAAATDMATVQSDVSNLNTWTGYNGTGATRLPVGTTAQRPGVPSTGHVRRNSTLTQTETYNGSGWERVITDTDKATQANMETATSTDLYVTPGRVQNHPGVAKAWVVITAGGTTVTASYNVTSVARTGAGDYTITFTTAFSSAEYAAFVTTGNDARGAYVVSRTTTTCRIGSFNTTTAAGADPSGMLMAVFFGDQ